MYPFLSELDNGRGLPAPWTCNLYADGQFEQVYRYTCMRTITKYQIREALDLWQCLGQMPAGDVAECGTYWGHSGLIIAEYLRRYGLERPVYLCDTFDRFPDEEGPDRKWSGTHPVDFRLVKELFAAYDFVKLVQGDFADTLGRIECNRLALAHLDCDSYRGTKLALDWAWDKLSPGGLILCQDYGRAHCPGARVAVDEFEAGFKFFSIFSGVMVIRK